MSNKIILKKSSVADKAPTTGDLEYGELAINYADKRLYFRDSTNNISYFGTGGGGSSNGTVTSVDASGGNTGLSFTGGPITSNGTLTLSGVLNIANGGTGVNSISSGYVTSNGTILSSTATILGSDITGDISGNANNVTGVVTTIHGGTGQSTYTQGDLLYASAANTLGKLGIGSNNQVLTVSNGTLSWANTSVTNSSGSAGQIQLSGGSGTFASNSEFSYSTGNRTLTLGDGGSPISNNSYWTGQTYTISGSIADAGYNGDKLLVSGGTGGIQAQEYYSSVFPGNGVLSVGSSSNLAPGTGDFTVEFFARFTSFPSTGDFIGIFQNDAIGSSSDNKFWVGLGNDGGQQKLYLARHGPGNPGNANVSLSTGVWHHIAMVRNSGTTLMFLDGVALSVADNTSLNGVNFGQNGVSIGGISTPKYFTGYLSNLRYTVGDAVYTSNFTVPSTPLAPLTNTQLLTCQDSTFIDNSNNNFTVTNSGTITTTNSINPFNTGPEFGYGGPLVLSGGTSYASAKSGSVVIQTDGADRVIIDNYGNFIQNANTALAKNTIVGVTSQRTLLAKADAGVANNVPITAWNNATANDNVLVEFGTEDTYTTRGNITYNRTAGQVSYNTTSDYRLKVVVGPVTNSGHLIDNLKVYTGMMLDAEIIRPMMVAHEAQEYVPYAVSGEKDAVDENGNPILQQMDHSILVPLLIAEIQSLRARVKQLEDRDSK